MGHFRWAGAGRRTAAFSDNVYYFGMPTQILANLEKEFACECVPVPNREVERSRYALLSRPTCAKVAKVGNPLGSCDEIVAYLALFRQVCVHSCDARS